MRYGRKGCEWLQKEIKGKEDKVKGKRSHLKF
jgi:hypothetical protein